MKSSSSKHLLGIEEVLVIYQTNFGQCFFHFTEEEIVALKRLEVTDLFSQIFVAPFIHSESGQRRSKGPQAGSCTCNQLQDDCASSHDAELPKPQQPWFIVFANISKSISSNLNCAFFLL